MKKKFDKNRNVFFRKNLSNVWGFFPSDQGGLRSAGSTTVSRAGSSEPRRPTDGIGVVSSASFGMSSSMPIPSILPDPNPTTQPRVRLHVQDQPLPMAADPNSGGQQTDPDVFVGDASGLVSLGTPIAPPSGLATVDQGTVGDNEDCGGIFRFPSGCTGDSCSYVATWRPGSNVDEIEFTLESAFADLWTGIGFSDDKFMVLPSICHGLTDRLIDWSIYLFIYLLMIYLSIACSVNWFIHPLMIYSLIHWFIVKLIYWLFDGLIDLLGKLFFWPYSSFSCLFAERIWCDLRIHPVKRAAAFGGGIRGRLSCASEGFSQRRSRHWRWPQRQSDIFPLCSETDHPEPK